MLAVSKDLPFAHARFCTVEGIENVVPVSDFRKTSFDESYGVLMTDGPLKGLLARSVVVIMGNPPVLILDEPTVGLDPNQIIEMRNLIRKLGKKHTVILSSHVLSEVQATCDRIVVINKGKIVADDMKDSMTSRAADNKLVAVIEGREQGVISAIRNISGVVNVRKTGEPERGCGEYTIECKDEADIRRALFKTMATQSMPILMLHRDEYSLEDVFIRLTQGEGGDK